MPSLTSTTTPPHRPRSVIRLIMAHPYHRAALISLVISGIGVSITAPQVTLFLVEELGASLPVAGLYYLTNVTAPVAGFVIGALSDRTRDRLLWFRISGVVGFLGWLALAFADQVWMAFVISTLALSVAGVSGAQLFAAARDEVSRQPTGMDNRVLATLRMGFTVGWVIGPVLGSWVGELLGLRALLVVTAVLALGKLVPMGTMRIERYRRPDAEGRPQETPKLFDPAMGRLLVFTVLCVLVFCGDTIKFAYLPIHMDQQLRLDPTLRGAVIAVQPLLELVLMPFAARFADRFGAHRVVCWGAALAIGGNLAYATSTGVGQLFLGQVLMSGTWACIAALGVSVAQQLYPQGVGTASSVFLSAIPLSGAIGGAIGGLGVAALGLPSIFFVPVGLSTIAVIGMLVLGRRLHGRPDPTPT